MNIPLAELAARTHELPAKDLPLVVADFGVEGVIEALQAGGRTALLRGEVGGRRAEGGLYRLWSPNAFLEQQVASLAPGKALDLACGTGRDAVFLAALGWEVTAVDWLPDGIERARDLERRYSPPGSPPIRWVVADLREWRMDEAFDLVTMFFWLDLPLLRSVKTQYLVLETFTPTHQQRFGKPSSPHRVLSLDLLPKLLPDFEVLHAEEGWRPKGHTLRFHSKRLSESI